jgi:predicted NUDIX family NTP pyrophosphohydrolase
MPKKLSAGIVLYRIRQDRPEVFLVHPGGPFWTNKDDGAWSIPKGEFDEKDDPLAAARREFFEETGCTIDGKFHALTPVKQPSGKLICAWAVEGDVDVTKLSSNYFSIEWPPRSGKHQEFPEVDRGGWFDLREAEEKLLRGQRPLLDQLRTLVTSAK